MKWPDKKTERLLTLFHRGDSYGLIADDLRITRSAVAGKVGRLGLSRKTTLNQRVNPSHTPGNGPRAKWRLRPTPPVPEVTIPGRECSIWELDKARCRYPFGEPRKPGFHFCGQIPQEGSPYCGPHHRLTHKKPKVANV